MASSLRRHVLRAWERGLARAQTNEGHSARFLLRRQLGWPMRSRGRFQGGGQAAPAELSQPLRASLHPGPLLEAVGPLTASGTESCAPHHVGGYMCDTTPYAPRTQNAREH